MTANLSRPVSVVWLIAGGPWDVCQLLRSVEKQIDARTPWRWFPSPDQPRWGWNGTQMCSPYVGTWHHSFLMHGGEPLFGRLLPYKHWCKLYGWLAHIAPPVLRVVPCKTNLIWPQSKVQYIFLNLQSFGSQSNHEYNGELGNIQDFMREWYLFFFFLNYAFKR